MTQFNPLRYATAAAATALCVFCIAWEIWLAPLRPGAWLLSLKAVPLLLALPGLWRGHLRTFQWWSMLILIYLAEGLVRGMSDPGPSATLGWIEAGLSTVIFLFILLYCRARLQQKKTQADQPPGDGTAR
jgi:uncharacterized membrane protein